jgi:hypothetical protein
MLCHSIIYFRLLTIFKDIMTLEGLTVILSKKRSPFNSSTVAGFTQKGNQVH